MLAVAFVVYYFSFQTGYAVVNWSVQKDLDLSIASSGDLSRRFTPGSLRCASSSAAPYWTDWGPEESFRPSIALVTVGIFVFANAESYQVLLLSQLIIAVGACSGFVGAGYIGGQWFGFAKFSFMFGLVQFAASFFSALNQNSPQPRFGPGLVA